MCPVGQPLYGSQSLSSKQLLSGASCLIMEKMPTLQPPSLMKTDHKALYLLITDSSLSPLPKAQERWWILWLCHVYISEEREGKRNTSSREVYDFNLLRFLGPSVSSFKKPKTQSLKRLMSLGLRTKSVKTSLETLTAYSVSRVRGLEDLGHG